MLRVIKLTPEGVNRLKIIRQDIIDDGSTTVCPGWSVYAISAEHKNSQNCTICKKINPAIRIMSNMHYWKCPCETYSSVHNIRRLTEIINYNERLQNEK